MTCKIRFIFSTFILFCGCSVLPVSAQINKPPVFRPAPKPAVQNSAQTAREPESKLDEIQHKAEAMGVYSQTSSSHMLGAGDVIEIKVYQEDELNTKVRVDNGGKITMPLLGAIKVTGQSVEQAQVLIRDLLAQDYLHSPQVSVTLLEFAKKRFSVLGEVNQPGFYMIPEGETMTVLQAIAMAGGFTPFARSQEILIKRRVNGREEIVPVDAKSIAKKKRTPNLEILPGDTLYVNQSIF